MSKNRLYNDSHYLNLFNFQQLLLISFTAELSLSHSISFLSPSYTFSISRIGIRKQTIYIALRSPQNNINCGGDDDDDRVAISLSQKYYYFCPCRSDNVSPPHATHNTSHTYGFICLKGIHLLMPRFGLHLSSGFHLQLPKYFSNLDTAILFNCAREENHMDGQTPLKSIPTRRWTDPKTVIQYINIKDDLKPPKGLCNCKRIRLRAQTNYYYYSHHH